MNKDELADRLNAIKAALVSGQQPGVITDTIWLDEITTVVDELDGLRNHVLTGHYFEQDSRDQLVDAARRHFHLNGRDINALVSIVGEFSYPEGWRTVTAQYRTNAKRTDEQRHIVGRLMELLRYGPDDRNALRGIAFTFDDEQVKEFVWNADKSALLFVESRTRTVVQGQPRGWPIKCKDGTVVYSLDEAGVPTFYGPGGGGTPRGGAHGGGGMYPPDGEAVIIKVPNGPRVVVEAAAVIPGDTGAADGRQRGRLVVSRTVENTAAVVLAKMGAEIIGTHTGDYPEDVVILFTHTSLPEVAANDMSPFYRIDFDAVPPKFAHAGQHLKTIIPLPSSKPPFVEATHCDDCGRPLGKIEGAPNYARICRAESGCSVVHDKHGDRKRRGLLTTTQEDSHVAEKTIVALGGRILHFGYPAENTVRILFTHPKFPECADGQFTPEYRIERGLNNTVLMPLRTGDVVIAQSDVTAAILQRHAPGSDVLDRILTNPPSISIISTPSAADDSVFAAKFTPGEVDTGAKRIGFISTDQENEQIFFRLLGKIGAEIIGDRRPTGTKIVRFLILHSSLDVVPFGEEVPEYYFNLGDTAENHPTLCRK